MSRTSPSLGARSRPLPPAIGVLGPGTAQAARDYQSSRGPSADGIVGPATWGALQTGK